MKYYWFVFCKTELLLEKTLEGQYTIPYGEEPPVAVREWTTVHTVDIPEPLRSDDGATEVKTFRIDTPYQRQESNVKEQERDMEMCGLRASYHLLPRPLYLIAGKCQEILYWDANTKFCGVCGAPMKLHTNISKRCTECGQGGLAAVGNSRHRAHPAKSSRREPATQRSAAGTCQQFPKQLLWSGGRIRGNRRNAGGSRCERSEGRSGIEDCESSIFRFPALALSLRTDGRIQCRLCRR